MKRVVLASGSFWRKELLVWMGVSFEVRVSGFDERVVKEAHPPKLVAMLAFGKAMAVGDRLREEYGTVEETVIIGADTLVWADGEAIGKPENLDEARVILNKLRGKFHEVLTGVAVLGAGGEKLVEVDRSRVAFRNFSDQEREDYLASGESLGKAGAYMILGGAKGFVESVEGSVTGVVGLPLGRLKKMLARVGVETVVDVSAMLKRRIGYED